MLVFFRMRAPFSETRLLLSSTKVLWNYKGDDDRQSMSIIYIRVSDFNINKKIRLMRVVQFL